MPPKPSTPLQYAVYLLSRQDYSRFVLRKKLKARFPEEEIDSVLDTVTNYRYLDDERYSVRLVKDRLQNGWGPHAIIMKAREKGITLSAADVQSIATDAEVSISEALLDELRRYLRTRCKGLTPQETRQKCWGHLARRGFDSAMVRDAIQKEVAADESDFSEGC